MRHTTDKIVAQYRASGLTQKDFCKRMSVPFSTLQYHLNKLKQRAPKAQTPTFIPIPSFQATRHIKRMIIIEGFDAEDLRMILAGMEN